MIPQYIGRSALIGSLLFTLLMMVAPLAAEQGKTEREIRAAELTRVVRDAIANDIAQLGGAKIGKLATHLDVTIPDKTYSCLCRTYPRSGHVGVKAEGGECHFSGLGSWTEPLPGGGSDWQGCIGSNTPEGETDLFGAVTDELANGTVDLGYSGGMHYGLKVMDYRRDCLPTPPHASADEYEAANMKQVGIYQALSKPMRVALRDTLYEKANAIADGESDPCNAAIASKLYMDGQEGRFVLDVAADAVWQLKRPQVVDYVEGLAQEYARWEGQGGAVDPSNAFVKIADHDPSLADQAVQLHKFFSGLSTTASLLMTVKEQYEIRGRNAQHNAAFELFQSTRDAKPEEIEAIRSQLNDEITKEQANVARLMEERQKALTKLWQSHYDASDKAVQLQMEKRRQQQSGRIVEFTQRERNRDLDYERARVNMEADFRDRIGEVSTRIGTLMLKDHAMEEYRLPLAKDGCEAFIEARKKAGLCPGAVKG